MNEQRFDEFAKTVAERRSRRRVLKSISGTAAGGLLSMLGLTGSAIALCIADGKPCSSDEDCCSATCDTEICVTVADQITDAAEPTSESEPGVEEATESPPAEPVPVEEPTETAIERPSEGESDVSAPAHEPSGISAEDGEGVDPVAAEQEPNEEKAETRQVEAAAPPIATAEADGPIAMGQVVTTDAVQFAADQFHISSMTPGWQQTTLSLQQGQQFMVSYVSGTWTVDTRLFPYVGPEGYTLEFDSQIFQGCKLDASLPYAKLLGMISDGAFFSVGQGGTFTANASGLLALRIHDSDACLGDNDGSITVMATGEKNPHPADMKPQQRQAIDIARTIISYYNKICNMYNCPGYSRSLFNKVITFIGGATTILGLGAAIPLTAKVAADERALLDAIKTHGKNSPEAKTAAHQLCVDTQSLQQALMAAVPGLSLVFPVPSCP